MTSVQSLRALARLDDPGQALAYAESQAALGDESWEQWVAEYRRGEALIVRLKVAVEISDGTSELIEVANRGVFVEKDCDPPKVEQQIAELASKDFPVLARKLADRGVDLDERDLAEMHVEVELADDVRHALSDAGARRRTGAGGPPQADAKLSAREDPA